MGFELFLVVSWFALAAALRRVAIRASGVACLAISDSVLDRTHGEVPGFALGTTDKILALLAVQGALKAFPRRSHSIYERTLQEQWIVFVFATLGAPEEVLAVKAWLICSGS